MPVSLRLSPPLEAQIMDYALRTGLNKTAVIVKSVQEFLERNAQPSAPEIYRAVMREAALEDQAAAQAAAAARDALETRPHKIKAREAARRKHAERSERAIRARELVALGGGAQSLARNA